MASPVDLTAIFGGLGGILGGAAAWWGVFRKNRRDRIDDEHDHDATDVASWTSLNTALDREIKRLHAEMDRQREDYERKLRQQAEDYERQLALRDKRIGELEKDVDSLQRSARLLRGERDNPP